MKLQAVLLLLIFAAILTFAIVKSASAENKQSFPSDDGKQSFPTDKQSFPTDKKVNYYLTPNFLKE